LHGNTQGTVAGTPGQEDCTAVVSVHCTSCTGAPALATLTLFPTNQLTNKNQLLDIGISLEQSINRSQQFNWSNQTLVSLWWGGPSPPFIGICPCFSFVVPCILVASALWWTAASTPWTARYGRLVCFLPFQPWMTRTFLALTKSNQGNSSLTDLICLNVPLIA
jgi:hypothetical protein